LQQRVKQWTRFWYIAFIGLYILTTGALFVKQFSIIRHVQAHWWTWGIVIFLITAILSIPFCLRHKKEVTALLASGGVIAGTFFLFGMGLYPTLLPSRLDSSWNLTIYNAAASEKTLFIMLIVAAIGLPFVLAYTVSVYWVFRGKVYTKDKLL
jgi:cytochrome d ubiquinol oxidase subunit II